MINPDVISKEWLDDRRYSTTRFYFYTSNFGAHEQSHLFMALKSVFGLVKYPLRIAQTTLNERPSRDRVELAVRYIGGRHQLSLAKGSYEAPACDYLIFLSPIRVRVDGTESSEADRSVAAAQGLLRSLLGVAIVHTSFGTMDFCHLTGKYIENPTGSEFTSTVIHHSFAPSSEARAKLSSGLREMRDEESRSRIELCLSLRGMEQNKASEATKVLNYWIALEVLFGRYGKVAGYIDRLCAFPEARALLLSVKKKARCHRSSGYSDISY